MPKILISTFVFFLMMGGCKPSQPVTQKSPELPKFDTQGHRGARGLMPENTIPAMRKAINLGMTTIEMDCHITKDKQVVVTHDPHINPLYASKPDGSDLIKEEAKKYAVYDLTYEELRRFRMGEKAYDLFPQQRRISTYIPRLSELIDSVQTYLKVKKLPQVFYNIETKSSDKGDNKLHPGPAEFARLLVQVIHSKKITPWVTIQSFDPRTLQEVHKEYPDINTALLVSNQESLEVNLQKLGYTPTIYSPNVKLVTPELVQKCHRQNIKVIPWTANTKEEMMSLKAMGVDGIISDYPNLLAEIK